MSSAAMAHLLQLGRPDATPRLPATAVTATLTPPLFHGPHQDPATGMRGACVDLAQTRSSSFRSGFPARHGTSLSNTTRRPSRLTEPTCHALDRPVNDPPVASVHQPT